MLHHEFLAMHFCNPEFRREWHRIEHNYHHDAIWDYYRMYILVKYRGSKLAKSIRDHNSTTGSP